MTAPTPRAQALLGRRAIVVGGVSGIGLAIVERFRAEGAQVRVLDLGGAGIDPDFEVDVLEPEAVARAVDEAVSVLGGLDLVVYNSGVVPNGGVADLPRSSWDRAFGVNVTGAFDTAQAVWAHLEESGGGVFLATSSGAGLRPFPSRAAYSASKAALTMLTRSIALEGAPVGIRAHAICPGFVDTASLREAIAASPTAADDLQHLARMHPLGRLGTPEEVAEAFVHLAGDAASWMTGVVLPVDGGLTTVGS